MGIAFDRLKHGGPISFYVALTLYKTYRFLRYNRIGDESYLKKVFYQVHGYHLNLNTPKSLNEKIQWLKINDRRTISTQLADKYEARKYIKKHFGKEYLVPLIFVTSNPDELNPNNLPNYPFIIKTNHNSGKYKIVRDKNEVNWKKLKTDLKWSLSLNYYYQDREWQYKNIEPKIIVEKLLVNKNGRIPNDYKLHCINGKVAFVYVSIDREGKNKRNIYSKDWTPLDFTLANKRKNTKKIRGDEIDSPESYPQMIEFAERIAKLYAYVRIDFYDINGKLYFGEVTHHHGGGFDKFNPIDWDYKWGKMVDLDYTNKYKDD